MLETTQEAYNLYGKNAQKYVGNILGIAHKILRYKVKDKNKKS